MFISAFIPIFIALWLEYIVCTFLPLEFQGFFGGLNYAGFVNVP